MNAISTYKQNIDKNIEQYCSTLLSQTEADYGPYSLEAMETYCSLLSRGGKRVRGSMTTAAYKMAGGNDEQMITNAARIVEMLNTNLLVFDDIADLSDKRRGGPTVHRMFEDYHRENKLHGDDVHFGVSMALHVGLAGTYLVSAELDKLNLPEATKQKAIHSLNENVLTTIHGQFNDIANEAVRLVNENQVNRTLTWKAAYYTFLQPVQFGLMLAGDNNADSEVVRNYAINIGLAYQIIDDIIGTFGDEDQSGKSNTDDVKEGKITLLISRALQKGSEEQKKKLLESLGSKDLTEEEFEQCRQILRETGALDYAREQANMRAEEAIEALKDAPESWSKEGLDYFRDMADFVVSRNK